MGSSHGTTTWSQPPSLTSPNDAYSLASNKVLPETCERLGQINNFAPVKTDIISPFLPKGRAGALLNRVQALVISFGVFDFSGMNSTVTPHCDSCTY